MKVVMILPNLMLQKPSAKSKTKDHTKALEQRLAQWKEGKIFELWRDCRVIQNKMKTNPKSARTPQDVSRIFAKLIFEGKTGPALKFLEENMDNSVLEPTTEVVKKLKELHPLYVIAHKQP